MTDQSQNKSSQPEAEYPGKPAPPSAKHGFLLLIVAIIVVIVVVIAGVVPRMRAKAALKTETDKSAVPTVDVIQPKQGAPHQEIVLPGNIQAFTDAPIYARTNGYLKKWYVDIGARVKAGQLLAVIDTPEVDQQLSQARADLNTSKANEDLSKITAVRYQELIKTDGVSKQEVDNAVGDYAAKKATTASNEANVRRLEDLESFKHIYAPFSGVITQRNIDIGNLINAGNGGTAQQLFNLAQTDPIRAYVRVPEVYAGAIRAGLGAYLELAQYPGDKFQGKVARTADAIDLASRTLNTEVDVPNKDGRLLPGGYAQVHLLVKVEGQRLQVPVNALLFRSEGLRAVTIDENHKTHLQPLSIGRDYGTALEVLQGLKATDWIVLNPPDSLEEGLQVHVKEMPRPTPLAGVSQPAQSNGAAAAGSNANGNPPPSGNKN